MRWIVILSICMAYTLPVQAFNLSLGDFVGDQNGQQGKGLDLRRVQQGLKLAQALIPISDEDEIIIGRNVAARVISRFGIDNNPEATYYINLLGTTLAQRSNRPDIAYHFAILDTNDVNAYACPGGFIFITRGVLRTVKDEAELAAVLAHEIAHVTERHIIKALQKSEMMKVGAQVAADALSNGGPLFDNMINTATDSLFKGLKKGDEYDADKQAIIYLSHTGYDYPAMFDVLSLLERQQKAGKAKILSQTHPTPANRIKNLRKAEREIKLEEPTSIRLQARFKQRGRIKKTTL